MAKDCSPYLRRAVLARLKTAAAGGNPLPAASIYPPQRPANVAWPFVGYGVATTSPLRASGMDGATLDFAMHVFAATTGTGNATIGGEAKAGEIARWIAEQLDDAVLDLELRGCPFPAKAYLSWGGTQTIADDSDADAFHSIVSIAVTVSS